MTCCGITEPYRECRCTCVRPDIGTEERNLVQHIRLKGRPSPRTLGGHPWIFRSELAPLPQTLPGELVEVQDARGALLGTGYINAHSTITVRLLLQGQRLDPDGLPTLVASRLEQAWALRTRLMPEESSFRWVYSEADGLPGLIVDRMADFLCVQFLTAGVEAWRPWLVPMLAELGRAKGVFERSDAPVRELEGLTRQSGPLWGEEPPRPVWIEEHGMRFGVDLWEGQKTGHFFDQRLNRRAVVPLAGGARVLDAFCHTGGFALWAAKGGAREVLAVDSSAAALAAVHANAEANGIDQVVDTMEANAFDLLRQFDRARERFDLIILDPPAFAKNRAALPGAHRGYKEINLRAMRLLRPGGFLVTCSCSQVLDEEAFLEILNEAATDARVGLRLLERRGAGPDHPGLLGAPETRYLKTNYLQLY